MVACLEKIEGNSDFHEIVDFLASSSIHHALTESPVKKVKRSDLDAAQIAKDAEIARLLHEKELAEMEREREERQRQDQASVDYIASLYDEVQAKMDASEELAARLQMEEREMYTIEERSKLLVEFFEMRKKLLAKERAAAVRKKPPTRTQLRSLMMTYLKHTGKYKHNQLNKKTFEEIQDLYIKEQERDAYFVPIGSERDEKMIDKMNKKAAGMDEEEVPEETESTKKSKRQKTDSDLEEEEQLRASLKIVPNEEEEIDYEVLGTGYPIVNWESAFYHTDRYGVPHDYYRVFKANGSSRYIKTSSVFEFHRKVQQGFMISSCNILGWRSNHDDVMIIEETLMQKLNPRKDFNTAITRAYKKRIGDALLLEYVYTANVVREKQFALLVLYDIGQFIEDVITKTIEYCLLDVVVEFHRFQSLQSSINAVKRIFRYLKHQPKLGLWYPWDSPFELEAFSDSDYARASLNRKSTTGGCQFLGRRLISWQ
ncbi:hypothetical protein Tco_1474797 [Tanacetum coccineum]